MIVRQGLRVRRKIHLWVVECCGWRQWLCAKATDSVSGGIWTIAHLCIPLREHCAVRHPANKAGAAIRRLRTGNGSGNPKSSDNGNSSSKRNSSGNSKDGGGAMDLVGVGDLAERWQYTPRGVRQMIQQRGFPQPCARINGGRLFVWELSAIEEYERDRPELHSATHKKRKQVGYYLALQKGVQT